MNVKTVKMMIIFAEGFSYNESLEAFYMQGSTWIHFKHIQAWEFYPILLHRAIEGFNKECYDDSGGEKYIGFSDNGDLMYMDYGLEDVYLHTDFKKTEYLTPQEQSIEKCLIDAMKGFSF